MKTLEIAVTSEKATSRISMEVKEIKPWVGQYSFSPYAYETSPDGDDSDHDGDDGGADG